MTDFATQAAWRLTTAFLRRRAAMAQQTPTPTGTARDPQGTSDRQVITREEAMAMAKIVLGLRQHAWEPGSDAVKFTHRVLHIVRITNNTEIVCATVDHFWIEFMTRLGSQVNVAIGTNVHDIPTLRDIVRNAEHEISPMIRPEDSVVDPDPWWKISEGKHTYLPVALWHPATQAAMLAPTHDVVGQTMDTLDSSGFNGAATFGFLARATLIYNAAGKDAFGEDTDSEMTVTAYTRDGKSSGWSGQAERNWAKMQPTRVVHDALDMAERGRNPVRVEPGRYTAILDPAAVGALVAAMSESHMFNAEASAVFTHDPPINGKETKIGERVLDSRLTISHDPQDSDYGDYPFFGGGHPSGKATWVKDGVLTALSYSEWYALKCGKIPLKEPPAIRVSGGDTSIEQMIARCERGIYVNRLTGVGGIPDGPAQKAGMMIGTTRDGCFLVKNGKIHSPVTNFRIYESPVLAFNKILALGTPKRVAFGFSRGTNSFDSSAIEYWPVAPVVVPPMMIQDFNFVSLADAV